MTERTIISKAELTRRTGLQSSQIDDYLIKGLPVITRGGRSRKWKFCFEDVMEWIDGVKNPIDYSMQERRYRAETLKAEYLAEKHKIELEVKKGQYFPIADVISAYQKDLSMVKQKLLSLTRKLPQLLAGETDLVNIRDILFEEINECLEDLHDDPTTRINITDTPRGNDTRAENDSK